MKILLAIQGTGNGHLSRARDVYPELYKYGDVDVLISGVQADVEFPFPVKYKLYGMSFIFGKRGGVSILETAKRLRLLQLIRDIKRLPVDDYDIVINDFEPVSSWACRRRKITCISLSHQSAVLNEHAPRPKHSDRFGKFVLKNYAPVTDAFGFHFKAYGDKIFTPVIRSEIRNIRATDEGHYTVYLPAYDDATLVKHLSHFKEVHWKVFSKHNKTAFRFQNIEVQPINNDAFIASMASGRGVLCGAGFEGPAEALFLGKKLLAIPMQNQYEQQCNAAALESMGVPIISSLHRKYYPVIQKWIDHSEHIAVEYPDQTARIIYELMKEYAPVKRKGMLQQGLQPYRFF